MRVIAGSARRLQLKTIDGPNTRPTTDRIKETLFNMIQSDLLDSNFLDLFSGSGAIGIEALSRGAKLGVFVEQDPNAVNCIRENLVFTKLSDQALLLNCHVLTGLRKLSDQRIVFDFIFLDPPYDQNLEYSVLEYLNDSELIHADTTIIVESSLQTTFDDVVKLGYQITKQKVYKTNQHVFLTKGE